ncbi:cache domain-containing protein [Paenibacillus sp. D2_2]|uniref:cache domain-containing protein n=1 Tax=Paenibacillus sp. D2_2 TaxID=3073092 RepID=UPI0028166DD4|nr:cache domain-containing protein [Paenibacillus sp. D2_2]WMT38858.1 cache domain-containing protein [Paenibacillus sp. D2_2]
MRSFRSIHNRLFLLLLVGMLALVLITTYLYYQRATEQIRTKVSDIAEKNMSQTAGLFDLLLKSYDSVTKSLNSNSELIRLLQDRGNKENPVIQVNNDQRITDTLGAIFYSRDDIVGIHIVTYSGRVYSYERSMGGMVREYAETAWFRILRQSSGEMKWLGVYPHSLMSGGFDKPVFAFGRQLFELSELKQIGIVLIETDASAIISALSNASLGEDSVVAIRDEHGMEIISTAEGERRRAFHRIGPLHLVSTV